MDAGKLNSRILFYRPNQASDGFGGFQTGFTTTTNVWGHYKQLDGPIVDENGLRRREIVAEIICRKKSLSNVRVNDILRIDSTGSPNNRIIKIFESDYKYFTTIHAVLTSETA